MAGPENRALARLINLLQNALKNWRYTNRSARFTAIITTDAAGITNSAFFSRFGSPPAIEPIILELTANPSERDYAAL